MRSYSSLRLIYRLDPANWLIVKNTDKEMTITHRYTGTIRKIPKEKTQLMSKN